MEKPDELRVAFLELFIALADAKPNDRSEKDRAFAIIKTELEKVWAYYLVYIAESDISPD